MNGIFKWLVLFLLSVSPILSQIVPPTPTGGGNVLSVNGYTGAVDLVAHDVGTYSSNEVNTVVTNLIYTTVTNVIFVSNLVSVVTNVEYAGTSQYSVVAGTSWYSSVAGVALNVTEGVTNIFFNFANMTNMVTTNDVIIQGNLTVTKTMFVTNVYGTNMYVTFTNLVVRGDVNVAEGDIVASNNVTVHGVLNVGSSSWSRTAENNKVEYKNNVYIAPSLDGGVKTVDGLYTVHTFTNSGMLIVPEAVSVELLVVAGGGGGGIFAAGQYGGGGGGGGGVIYTSAYMLISSNYSVVVGKGGGSAQYGSNTVFDTLTAYGGGYGGSYFGSGLNGFDGGSGGGGSAYPTAGNGGLGVLGQGYDGGKGKWTGSAINGGGGGGGGGIGGDAGAAGGIGGLGFSSTISGVLAQYGGGGGGGSHQGTGGSGSGGGGTGASSAGAATAGVVNRGGGGGGGGSATLGASGGSGVVIVRYLTAALTNGGYIDQTYLTVKDPVRLLAMSYVEVGNSNADVVVLGDTVTLSGSVIVPTASLSNNPVTLGQMQSDLLTISNAFRAGDTAISNQMDLGKAANSNYTLTTTTTLSNRVNALSNRVDAVTNTTVLYDGNVGRLNSNLVFNTPTVNTNTSTFVQPVTITRNIAVSSGISNAMLRVYGTNTALNSTYGDVMYESAIVIDGASNVDKHLVFAENGVPDWAWSIYRNEGGEYIYLYDVDNNTQPLMISEGGRFGVNKQSNIPDNHAYYTGTSQQDDMRVGGLFDKAHNHSYEVVIDSTGTPDKWKFRSANGDNVFGAYSAAFDCTTNYVDLDDGLQIYFKATTGHAVGDTWFFYGISQLPPATMSVYPTHYPHMYSTSNDVDFVSATYALTLRGTGYVTVLTGTNAYLYVGRQTPFNSTAIGMAGQLAVGLSLTVEAMTPTGWQLLNSLDNSLVDETINMSQDGQVRWEKSSFNWIRTNAIPSKPTEPYRLYWLRFGSSNTPSIAPRLDTVVPNGEYRFQVYAGQLDQTPVFQVDGHGKIRAYKVFRTSDALAFESSEYITEGRLQAWGAQFYGAAYYLNTNGTLSLSVPPASSNVVTTNTISAIRFGVYRSLDVVGVSNIAAATVFSLFAKSSKSLSAANRPASIFAQLLAIGDGYTNILVQSSPISYPASVSRFDFDLSLRLATNAIIATNAYLGVSVWASNESANAQTFYLYCGTGSLSALSYPASALGVLQLTKADLDAADAAIYANISTQYVRIGQTIGNATNAGALSNSTGVIKFYGNLEPAGSNMFAIGNATSPVSRIYVHTNSIHFVDANGSDRFSVENGAALINGAAVSDMVARASATSVGNALTTETENRQVTDRNVTLLAVKHARLANEAAYELVDGFGSVFRTDGDGVNAVLTDEFTWNTNKYYSVDSAGLIAALDIHGNGNLGYNTQTLLALGTGNGSDPLPWDCSEPHTVSLWCYPTNYDSQWGYVLFTSGKDDQSYTYGLTMQMWGNNYGVPGAARVNLYDRINPGDNFYISSTEPIPLNTWTHFAYTYSNNVLIGYTNGVEFARNEAFPSPRYYTTNAIGFEYTVDEYDGKYVVSFMGYLSQIGVHQVALDSSALLDLATATTVVTNYPECRLYLPLNRDTLDYSTNEATVVRLGQTNNVIWRDGPYEIGEPILTQTLTLDVYTSSLVPSLFVATAFITGDDYDLTNFMLRATSDNWTNSLLLGIVDAFEYETGKYMVTATGTVINSGTSIGVQIIATNTVTDFDVYSLNIQTDQ